jgi:hypothetical protein
MTDSDKFKPTTIDQQIYLELKNLTQVLVTISKTLERIGVAADRLALKP